MNKLIAAAAVFVAASFFAVSANAVTWLSGGNTYSIAPGNQFIGDVTTNAGGMGSWYVQFDAANPLVASTTAQIGVQNFANFTNLVVSWVSVATGNTLNSVAMLSGSTTLSTLFNSPSNLSQYLMFTWTASPDYGGFDISVAAVPLPAGFLLMGTALAGLGVIGRRRKAKKAAATATA